MIDRTIKVSCAFTEILTPKMLATYINAEITSAHTHHARSMFM